MVKKKCYVILELRLSELFHEKNSRYKILIDDISTRNQRIWLIVVSIDVAFSHLKIHRNSEHTILVVFELFHDQFFQNKISIDDIFILAMLISNDAISNKLHKLSEIRR